MNKITANIIYDGKGNSLNEKVIVFNHDGVILDVVNKEEAGESSIIKHYTGALCPGFINTHCHLELSHLKNRIEEHTGLDNFVKEIEKQRKATPEEMQEAAIKADEEMLANGIVAVGDISNSDYTFRLKQISKIYYHQFIELFSFHPDKAEQAFQRGVNLYNSFKDNTTDKKNVSITPHAPYSASDKLLGLITQHAVENGNIQTIHSQESSDENCFFKNKTGKLFERLTNWGVDVAFWRAPGVSSLKATLPKLSSTNNLLLVHNTFTNEEDIIFAMQKHQHLFWCLCPNANLYIENNLPPIDLLLKHNCKIALGTDSVASNHQLSVWEEIKTIQKHSPQIPLAQIIQWACNNGAEFLRIDNVMGSIEKNKKPGIVNIIDPDKKSCIEKVI